VLVAGWMIVAESPRRPVCGERLILAKLAIRHTHGPRSCPLYESGPARKVPGRHGMTYTEEDG